MHACMPASVARYISVKAIILTQLAASKLTIEIIDLCGALLALGAVVLCRTPSGALHAAGRVCTLSESIIQALIEKSCMLDAINAGASLL